MNSIYHFPESQIKNLEKIYTEYFNNKTNGCFIEVGANDGILASNSSGLVEVGWKGIYYEPIPELAEQCKKNLLGKNIKVINTCVGNYVGEIKLYLTYAEGMASTDRSHIIGKSKQTGDKNLYNDNNFIVCPITTLDKSLEAINFTDYCDLLLIDVEGAEYKVLQGFDIKKWNPLMAIVECHENHIIEELQHNKEIDEYFKNSGYTKIYSDELNNIYVKIKL